MPAPPFAPFFLLASLDAMAGIGLVLPFLTGHGGALAGDPAAMPGRHAWEMLFGYLAGVLAGFFLTALPRWTQRTPGRASAAVLLGLWLAGRGAPWMPQLLPPVAVAALLWLSALVSWHVIAAGSRRNYAVIALLWLLAAGGLCTVLPAGEPRPELGLRIGFAAAISLIMILGGRIVPSLTASWRAPRGEIAPLPRSRHLEALAAASGAAGLLAWLLDPGAGAVALAGAAAAAAQFARMLQWRGWTVIAAPSLLLLHLAYGFVPLGFALLSAAAWLPGSVPAAAGLHAWGAGAIGCMTLGVMASMIRRRTGRAFAPTLSGEGSAALAVLAAVLRIGAELAGAPGLWLAGAAAAWIGAFALFLFDFRAIWLSRS